MIQKPIIEVPYGLGSSYNDFIEINVKLKGKLREKIVDHELRHSLGKYTKEDFKNDFNSKNPYFFESIRFCIRNPEALIGFFPVMYSYYGQFWTYNSTALFPFIEYGLIWSIFWLVLFKINFFLAFLGWSCVFTIINLILLIYTHLYVLKAKKESINAGVLKIKSVTSLEFPLL